MSIPSDPIYCAGCKGVYDQVNESYLQYLAASNLVTEKTYACIGCGSEDLVDYDDKVTEVKPQMTIKTDQSNPYGNEWYAWDDNTYCGCGECGGMASGATEEEAIEELVMMTIETGVYDE